MAFKKLNSKINAVALGNGKDGTVKTVTGYLVGAELNKGARKNSSIFALQTKAGEIVKVWGSAATDSNLLSGEGKKRVMNPAIHNRLVRLTFIEARTFGEGKKKQTFKDISVEVDDRDMLKASKSLVLGQNLGKQLGK